MRRRRFLQGGALALSTATLSGCAALPRSGPLTMDIRGDADDAGALEGLVAPLTAEAAEMATATPPPGFPPAFLSAGPIDPTRLGVDDLLDITIWESEGAGLLNTAGGATAIEGARVDSSGRIFVPFAGHQRAAGSMLSDLRERIRMALEPLTLSPQVDVRLRDPRSRLVTLQGAVARPGVYPIERATARVAEMLAAAGGASEPPERVEVAVERGGVIGRQILAEIFDEPALNIALRPGDLVVLSPIRERFLTLGASSIQAEIPFPSRPLTLLSALGAARGLRDFDADPSGVFLFRYEDPAIADALLPGPVPPGAPKGPGRPIVYRLDLSEPQGFFLARRFAMRDGDAIFVSNAPLTELRKFLQLFNSVVAPVQTVDATAG
jgi:polysaccharide export outer membrane protein